MPPATHTSHLRRYLRPYFRPYFRMAPSVILIAAFAALVSRQISSLQSLYADGVNEFFLIAAIKSFHMPLWAKTTGDIIYSAPTLAAIRLFHLTNLSQLAKIHASTLFIHPYLGLFFCWLITRKKNPAVLIFPLLSFFVGNCSSSLFMVSQAHLTTTLFWPLLLFITFKESLSTKEVVIGAVYSMILTFTYQTSIFFCPLIAIILLTRRKKLSTMENIWVALLFMMGLIMLYAVVTYPDVSSRSSFYECAKLIWVLHSPPTILLLISGAVLVTSLFLDQIPGRGSRYFGTMASILSVALGFGSTFLLIFQSAMVAPPLHYCARVLMLYVPLVLGSAAAFSIRRFGKLRLSRSSTMGVLALALSTLVAQWEINHQWREYYQAYKQELKLHRGEVAFAQTRLGSTAKPSEIPGKFFWNWTNPVQSMVISSIEWGVVETIIHNPLWVDFDPYSTADLRRIKFDRYGIKYRF